MAESTALTPTYVSFAAGSQSYTATNDEWVVGTGAESFTVDLPVNPTKYPVATSAGVVSGGGVTYAVPPYPQHVRVKVIGDITVTVKTTDDSTIDGVAGASGLALEQFAGTDLYSDDDGNWVSTFGYAGAQGAQGSQGAQGAAGACGVSGVSGAQGAQGAIG
jgi:hypothetical protein